MKFKSLILAAFFAVALIVPCFGQATILPPGETCFSALAPTSGGPANTGTGFIGLLGTITGGSGYVNGTYGGVPLTGGSGSGATANITVSGGSVTAVSILNPGLAYVAGDNLSAAAANLGGSGSGFSVSVSSVSLNYALAGGSVGFYIPNTLSFKQTWQDSGETILNQNPVPLDANGCAVIYGAGIYRMIVKDVFNNTVYDKLTASTGPNGLFWAGTAGGTGNAITIVDSNFALQDGATIQFRANAANTGPTTIAVSSGGAISIVKDTSAGPAALSGGEIGIGNTPIITFDAVASEFHLVNPSATSSGGGSSTSLVPPQGYLNLVGQASGDVVQAGDVIAATTLFYSPFVGSIVPIFNGSTFINTQISELALTLTAAGSPGSAIQDACVFSNNGAPTLVLGPSWTTPTAGAGSRGTGAGTAQLARLQGIWVNAVSITGYNGLSSYTIPASQCTYVGSVSIDSSAGQITAHRTYGQSRKFGVWNAYNRQTIYLQAGDSTSSWTYSTNTFRPSNNNTANSLTVFSGLPEEEYSIAFNQFIGPAASSSGVSASATVGIGFNSTTVASGKLGGLSYNNVGVSAVNIVSDGTAVFIAPPSIGINVATSLEEAVGNALFNGANSRMILSAAWRG